MKTVKLVVEVSKQGYIPVAKRIKMLDGVNSVSLAQEPEPHESSCGCGDADILVKCGAGVRKCDVEELLLGVRGVTLVSVET